MTRRFDQLVRSGVIDELALCFASDEEARALLLASGVAMESIPPMLQAPAGWWMLMCQRLHSGAGSMQRVVARASSQYPHNGRFAEFGESLSGQTPAVEQAGAEAGLMRSAKSEPVRPGEPDVGWLHAHLLDRILQWGIFKRVFDIGHSTVLILHGHRDQALFQFVRRFRHERPIDTMRVVEVPFRRHGQDRGPMSAGLWARSIRRCITDATRADDVVSARRHQTLLVAVEVPQPKRRTEKARIVELALRHLPGLAAEPGKHPLMIVLVVEREAVDDNGFSADLGDMLRPVLQKQGVAFRRLAEVSFPDWHEIEGFLDEVGCPGDLHAHVNERYEMIRAEGGSFVALAGMIEQAIERWLAERE